MDAKRSMALDFPSSSMMRKRISVEDGNSNMYDVFISFRGEDTRNNFTSHVCTALSRKHIKFFIDNKDLRTGNEISGSLLQAIETSQLYLVIFSPDYGSSRWCLIELENILICSSQHGKKVLPVFYKVDPSDIRKQTGSFGINFATKHEGSDETEKVLNWRAALKEVGGLKGVHVNDHKPEPEFIDEIVAAILRELKPMLPLSNTSKQLVGINHHIENIQRLLCMNSEVVCRVGIWGMGGIGKTTIAKSVFARIGRQFDGYYFFEDIRGEIDRHGKGFFWSKFYSEELVGKKVFIVYDGVDDLKFSQIQELAELSHLLGGGSKILMTSRDSHVLKKLNVHEVYEVVGLREEEALKLFSLMAFKNEFPPMKYLELCSRVVRSAQGNPLALRVLGSHFIGRDNEKYWHSELEKIEGIYEKPVIELLRISYDALSPIEKEIFLDIVVFFKGEDKNHVESLLNGIYDGVYSSMTHLIEKCLISISSQNKIEIHDLMQQMGLEIANEEEANHGECKRLCNSKEIYRLLIGKTGIETIQGISLNLSEGKNMSFEVDVFSKMVNLRWLKIYGRNNDVLISDSQRMIYFQWLMRVFKRNKEVLPHLRYLCWEEFPLKSLPSMFNAHSLVKLSLTESKVERLWTGIQDVVNLKWMDLTRSGNLIEIPDLSKAINMEGIILEECRSLIRLHPSVQHLQKLEELNLSNCSDLSEIPSKLESKVLMRLDIRNCYKIREGPKVCGDKLEWLVLTTSDTQEFPDLREFVALRVLGLSHSLYMTTFPEVSNSLQYLLVQETGIEEVPSSVIESLTRLMYLWLSANDKLTSISSSISKLECLTELTISRCPLLSSIPELPSSLQLLEVQDCPSMEKVSVTVNNSCWRQIMVTSCPKLDDESSRDIRKQFFYKVQLGMDMTTCIDGSETPEESLRAEAIKDAFTMCAEGSSLTMQLSSQLNVNYSFTSFAVWAAVEQAKVMLVCDEELRTTGWLRVSSRVFRSLTLRILVHSQLSDEQVVQMETPLMLESLALLGKIPPPQLVMRSFGTDSYPCQQIREILSGKYGFNPKISFQFLTGDPSYVVTRCGIYVAGIQGAEFMSPTFLITQ